MHHKMQECELVMLTTVADRSPTERQPGTARVDLFTFFALELAFEMK